MNRRYAVKSRLRIAFIGVFILYTSIFSAPVFSSNTENIKVGFFAFDGYHMTDFYGNKSGYGYEYLQQIAKYTNFVYTYIGYEKSWAQMQKMLDDGEIDLLTSAQKTESRLEKFDFSDRPIGSNTMILTVKAGDTRFLGKNYDTYNGIRVGMLQNNSRNKSFDAFAKENHFTYRPVYFDDLGELTEALQTGEVIDAVVTSSLRATKNEWVVAEYDPSPFYVMVKKGNSELLAKINQAITQIDIHHPTLQQELTDTYYSNESIDDFALSLEERTYIQTLQAQQRRLHVLVSPDNAPLSYFEDGEAKGIIPEIAQMIFQHMGLDYTFIPLNSREEYQRLFSTGDVSICLDSPMDYNIAEQNHFKLTDAYMQETLSLVKKKQTTTAPNSIAILAQENIPLAPLTELYPSVHLERYATVADCMDAVLSGNQDAAYMFTSIANKIVHTDEFNRLQAVLLPNSTTSLAIAIKNTEDPLLITITNKAVRGIDSSKVDEIILRNTNNTQMEFSLLGYLYNNPKAIVVVVFLFLVFLFIVISTIFSKKNDRLQQERLSDFERFIFYICKSNDDVTEINFQGKSCWAYHVQGTHIVKQQESYPPRLLTTSIIHPDDLATLDGMTKEAMEQLIEHGEERYYECRIKEPGAKDYHWFAYTLQGMVKDTLHPKDLLVFRRNIDSAKKAEAEKRQHLQDALKLAQQSSEAKGMFLSRMSHEIRTPLNAILGYIAIARESVSTPLLVEDGLGKAEIAAKHLLSVINDVLDISSIESGKLQLAHDEFNIKQIISSVVDIFYAQTKEKGIKFSINLIDVTEELLIGDSLRLSQILMNLLSNAIKFTPSDGRVILEITQKAIIANTVHLKIVVADTGIGMSKDYMKRIFTPFEQQDPSIVRKFGGTGLGLSITKNLVSMMQGSITVESEEGKGTTFVVGLPFAYDSHELPAKNKLYDFSSLWVLVVDDNEASREYIRTQLNEWAVDNEVATDSGQALEILRLQANAMNEHQQKLCILDWDTEDDTVELVKRIRKHYDASQLIIVVKAFDTGEVLDLSQAIGISQVIQKPLFQSTLFDLLSNICGKYAKRPSPIYQRIKPDTQNIHALLVEDNEMNLEIANYMLENEGVTVTEAYNGKEAVEAFLKSRPDTYQVIFMDIQMPEMDGYEAARRIRASKHPQAKTIPIIAMTAEVFTEDVNKAFTAGMNGHISKPIDKDLLHETLASL